MALILAIEPDRRQASKVSAIVKNRLHAEIVQADTTEHAVEALGGRVPDLILTSLLLSRKDAAALADCLRERDESGRNVPTLVIPVLAVSSRDGAEGGGLLSRFTRGKSRDDATTDGCEPEVFAAQIREYLDRAAEERQEDALLREDAEALRAVATGRDAAPGGSLPSAAAARTPEHAPVMQARSWDSPYSDPADTERSVDFEVEAVTTDAAASDVDAPSEPREDDDAWSEITLGEETGAAAGRAQHDAYALEEVDDAAPLELTSEAIDLQRFVDELSNDTV